MRASIPAFFTLVLALPALAGCLALDDAVPLTMDDLDARVPRDVFPVAPTPFTHLLCEGDVLTPLTSARDAACNFRVTGDWGPAAEVSLAVNPTNPLNLVGGGKDFTLGEDENCGKYNVWSGAYASFDGGRTWNASLLPGYPGDPRVTALSDYACGSDPVLAFGPDGTLYYASLQYSDSKGDRAPHPLLSPFWGAQANGAIAVTRSLDGGASWEDPVIVASHTGDGILDKEWLAVDPETGQVYVSYFDGRFHVTRSDDGGLTWTPPVEIASGGGDIVDVIQFGQIGVGPDGLVHFIHFRARNDGGQIYHLASSDGGVTWTSPVAVADMILTLDPGTRYPYRVVGLPAIGVDPVRGDVYVAFPSRTPADLNIVVASSHDMGATWSTRVVNDDVVGAGNDQWMPAIAIRPDSAVHVTWLDYRDDATRRAARVYYTVSKDLGASWSANAPIGDVGFDGTGGYHQSGSGTIGDYMGLAVSEEAVHAFWADTRTGRNDVYSAIILARA